MDIEVKNVEETLLKTVNKWGHIGGMGKYKDRKVMVVILGEE